MRDHDAPLDILKPPTGEIVSVRDLFWPLCDILGLWALGPSWCDASDYGSQSKTRDDMGNWAMASFSHFSPKRTLTFSWTEKVPGSLCLNCHSKLPFSHHGGSHSKALHFQKGLAPGWQFIGHSTGESEWHQTPRHSLLKNRAFFGSHQTSCCITCWNNARLLTKSSGGGDLGRHPRQQRCKIIRFQWKLRWKRRISCEHGMNMDMRCVKIERSMRSIRLSVELLLMHNSSYQMLLLCYYVRPLTHILIPKSAACLCQYVFPNPTVQKISKNPFPNWNGQRGIHGYPGYPPFWDKPMASQLATKWPICCFGIVDAETHTQPIRSTEFSMANSDQSSLTCETLNEHLKFQRLVRPGCWNMLEYVGIVWENALLHHVRMQKNVLAMFGIPYSFPTKTGNDGLWSSWISPQCGLLRSAKKARQSKAHWHLEGLEGPARHIWKYPKHLTKLVHFGTAQKTHHLGHLLGQVFSMNQLGVTEWW